MERIDVGDGDECSCLFLGWNSHIYGSASAVDAFESVLLEDALLPWIFLV